MQSYYDLLVKTQSRMYKKSKYYVEDENLEVVPIKGVQKGLKKVDDIYVPTLIKNVSLAKTMPLREDDTFVIGYPRSGTTWVEEMVWLIKHNLDFNNAKSTFHILRVPYIDYGMSHAELDELPSPRVFKTHFPIKYLPDGFQNKAKVVYLVRNIKDNIVSMYKMLKSFKMEQFNGTFDDMVDLYLDGKMWYGTWWDHIDQYVNLPNIYLVHYETILENPIEEIGKLARFLGHDLEEEQIKQLLGYCSLSNMKKSTAFKYLSYAYDKEFSFFRKAQIGNWRDFFNEEQSKKVDEMVKKNLKYQGVFNYGAVPIEEQQQAAGGGGTSEQAQTSQSSPSSSSTTSSGEEDAAETNTNDDNSGNKLNESAANNAAIQEIKA